MKNLRLPALILCYSVFSLNVTSQDKYMDAADKFHQVNVSILQLFNQYPIVAIGEGQHNSALTFEWLSTLITEKEFPAVVRNIVVEFGASEYQSVMDDFVNNKSVPDSLFKKCWRETTQIMVWDNPIYEHFFREIKALNKGLSEEKRIRVLLGDESFGSRKMNDAHVFHIIEKEVLKKNQTALLIYGDLHFVKKDIFTNYAPATELSADLINVIQLLEIHYPKKAFSIWGSVNTNDSITKSILESEDIQVPAFIQTHKSKLGDVDFRTFYPYPTNFRTDNLGNDIDTAEHVQMAMKDIVDGILYRGSWETQNYIAPRPDHIYSDTVYLNELIRREQIVNIPPYRTRLYFYKIFESDAYKSFELALLNGNEREVDTQFQALKIKIPEEKRMDVLNSTGYFYLNKQDFKRSVAVFKLAIREFPDKFNPYDSLGDAYNAAGDSEKALNYYEQALQINPDSLRTRNKVEKLKYK